MGSELVPTRSLSFAHGPPSFIAAHLYCLTSAKAAHPTVTSGDDTKTIEGFSGRLVARLLACNDLANKTASRLVFVVRAQDERGLIALTLEA